MPVFRTLLEPDAVKVARPVLRGEGSGNAPDLPDPPLVHLGEVAYKRLILSHHKHLNNGHFLIDDRTKNGADRFQGEHILFGSDQFPDWPSVVHYLNGKII